MRKEIIAIMLVAAAIFFIYDLNSPGLWWDSAVYLGMGKYIWSLGHSGLWEPIRPVIWPVVLGLGWRIGIDPLSFAQMLTLACFLASVYLVYLISRTVFGEREALAASLAWSLSPLVMALLPQRMTDIPSIFLALLGIHLFIKGRYLWSGLVVGLAALTRFPQGLVAAALLFGVWLFPLGKWRHPKVRAMEMESASLKTGLFLLGFVLIMAAYLASNLIVYGNMLLPFTMGQTVVEQDQVSWLGRGMGYYLYALSSEGILAMMAAAGAVLVLMRKDRTSIHLFTVPTLMLAYLFSLAHKEARFLVMALPYLCMLAAYAWASLLRKGRAWLAVALIIGAAWAVQTAYNSPDLFGQPPPDVLQSYARENPHGYAISSPLSLLLSDAGATDLLYYPSFSTERAREISEKAPYFEAVLLNTCDLRCPPGDEMCPAEKERMVEALRSNLELVSLSEGDCEKLILVSGS